MTAQQKDIGSGWGPTEPQSRRRYPAVPAHPRQPTPRLRGLLLCVTPQPLLIVELDQDGTGASRWVHSRPVRLRKHRWIAPTVQYRRKCA